jgi:hypothetical protein
MIARQLTLAVLAAVATAPLAAAESAPFVPAKLYASMFVDATTIKLVGTRGERKKYGVRKRPVHVKCTVTNVRAGSSAVVAELACDKEMQSLAGVYGASAKGLYRVAEPGTTVAATAASVEAGDLVMPPAPAEGTVSRGKPNEPGAYEHVTTTFRDGFCFRAISLSGDMYQQRYCFAAGRLRRYDADDASTFPVVISLRQSNQTHRVDDSSTY